VSEAIFQFIPNLCASYYKKMPALCGQE